LTKDALINELLRQHRYSLFYEGHRWIDMRHYGQLNQLPLDQPGQTIFDAMPRPLAEVNGGK
jgi:starch-binding outer membrane protein, SusD/RagB family